MQIYSDETINALSTSESVCEETFCYVYSTLLFDVGTWYISDAMERRTKAFEILFFGRIVRITWVEKIIKRVLRRMGPKPQLL